MLNVVIIGASALGKFLADTLSKDKHNVIVIDKDKKKLEEISWNTDVATRVGEGTDWQLLDDLLEVFPDLLLALTNDDETNLIACSIAKQLGYPSTIARVSDSRFLNRTRLDFSRIFHVDYFIAPEILTASEIIKTVDSKGALAVEYFAHGAVQISTMKIPDSFKNKGIPLSQLKLPKGVLIGLILRKKDQKDEIIFPHGADQVLPGDEATFIGETEAMEGVYQFCGLQPKKISSVAICGGSLTAVQLARLLERRDTSVRIIEKDYDRCCHLAEILPKAVILNHDGLDLEFLKSEKISEADLFIACTRRDESNLMASMLAKEAGCKNVMMTLSRTSYRPLLDRLNISHVVSPLIIAANRILSHVFTETVTSLVSLYENQAEVLEMKVSMDSKVVGIPISDLGHLLPKDFLIAMIQNRGRIMSANGSRIISPGDTVIVITNPKHVAELEVIF